MGQVYRATDTRLHRDVALKVLPPEMAASSERIERFKREARAVAALNHPHVVTIYSVEEANGVHFLTMELVDGQPLERLIPVGGMAVPRLLSFASELADALAAAHDKGIVHRDLKPANVMVTRAESVKVLDFGLARMSAPVESLQSTTEDQATEMRTQEGVVMGTMPYMSPEQLHGQPLDHRTDLFSLGVMLYEMASGERPFRGDSSVALASAILRDTPRPLVERRNDLPEGLIRIITRCLEKNAADRFPSARDLRGALGGVTLKAEGSGPAAAPEGSALVRADEGFRVAVLPFKYSDSNPDLMALAHGLTEEIVTGLSRFSYLRVIARGTTSRYVSESIDVRTAGRDLGARYVMEGSLRQSGPTLRLAVQLVDASTGAHLWAETYERAFRPEEIFALQDELVPRIVSTVADWYGVLPRSMSESLRSKAPDQLSPYEAVLRCFGYSERMTAEEHAAARAGLERAVEQAPGHADCWAMLSMVYGDEYRYGFNAEPDPLGRAVQAARRATDAAPSNHFAWLALAQALFYRKELDAFRNAADRAVALNPMDGYTLARMGLSMAFSGEWERGSELAERATRLNPNHPGWYWAASFNNAYRKGDYRGALSVTLKMNMPGFFFHHLNLAAVYGQLGEREAAGKALHELLLLRPDFALVARAEIGKFVNSELVEQMIDGLRKAGLDVPAAEGAHAKAGAPAGPEAGNDVSSRASKTARDASAAELLEDLKQASRETPVSAFVSSRSGLAAPRRRLWIAIAITLFTLIVAAVVIVAVQRAQGLREAQRLVDASERSIAVLPFQNQSAEAENAFFTAGVHEDVLTYLSRVADLRVISRSSVMQYAAPGKNLREIAADLGVVYVVEGSVRRAGDRIRVAAQLIDARTDEHLWAENYDRELADVFTIQTAIAQEIVAALKATLSPREAEMLASRPTTSVEAYDLFLRARQLIQQLDATDFGGEPIRLLEEAIRLDPHFAHAYALVATQHGRLYWFLADRSPERLAQMKSAIDRAFALRPDLPEARVALAEYYYRGFYDYPRAVEELEKARLSLPNDSLVQYHLGLVYRRLGQADRSIDSFVQATRLDPANLRAYAESVRTARAFRRADRGVALAEAGLRRFPGDPTIAGEYAFLWLDHFGDIDRARAILDAAEAGPANSYWDAQYYSRLYAHEYRQAAEAALEPSVFESVARGWGRTQAGQALFYGGFDVEAKKMLIEAEKVLVAEVAKPYAENYGWPHLVYALNLALQSRGDEAMASCDRAMRILPFKRDHVHGAVFRQECAWVKAMAGRTDEALAEIALFLDHGYGFTRWQLALDPRWDFLRDNPRFRELSTPHGTKDVH
jgi:TolB-like protein/Tfp pilus assembly protein PilF